MKTETVKVGNMVRDLLMRQPETIVLGKNQLEYYFELYSFNPITKRQREISYKKAVNALHKLL